MRACWTFSSLEDEETTATDGFELIEGTIPEGFVPPCGVDLPHYCVALENIPYPPLQVNPLSLPRCQKLSTPFTRLLLLTSPESIFLIMEKVSKNSTSRKPKKELFARAGLNPVKPPSREDAVLAEIVRRYGDCRDQMNRLQFAILCELVDARLYREARGV